ncbi:unnamed protein product [Allacma fusca]|uniref:Hemocyanin C-terminal domain-containing protein n=1 Tax=Allacma fusca TaxID=39272 RepID=A0A8J2PTI3_9HEXA|nr:unnamed protein product [Allacma fusca]
MAPRNNHRGEKLTYRDQRLLFFELDKFTANLQPGNNVINRNSQDSTLVIPWGDTFRDLEGLPVREPDITGAQAVCSCGWPEHVLLPIGSPSGVTFDLFVLITNGADDVVPRTNAQSPAQQQGCRDAVIYCGILDELYPDRKPMGFPFDRNAARPGTSTPVATLDEYISGKSNMFTTQVIIRHSNTTTIRGGGAPGNMGRIDQNGNVLPGNPLPNAASASPSPGTQPPRGRPRQPQGQGQPQGPRQPQGSRSPQRGPQQQRPGPQQGFRQPSRSPSPQGWSNGGWGNPSRGFSPNNFWG